MTDGIWNLDTDLSGRDVMWASLAPAARAVAPGALSVVVVLAGEVTAGGTAHGPGELVWAPGRELVAGPAGGRLGAVRWDAEPPTGEVRIEPTDSRHFAKYESYQSQLHVRGEGGDALAPWELYRVRMVGGAPERVQLHVHHVVTNLLFVPGPTGTPRGYLIRSDDGRVTATPLVGGDRAIVRPGLHHHVVPFGEDPAEMLVFNDQVAAYEDVDRSDFHLVEAVPWSEIELVERPEPEPHLTIVE